MILISIPDPDRGLAQEAQLQQAQKGEDTMIREQKQRLRIWLVVSILPQRPIRVSEEVDGELLVEVGREVGLGVGWRIVGSGWITRSLTDLGFVFILKTREGGVGGYSIDHFFPLFLLLLLLPSLGAILSLSAHPPSAPQTTLSTSVTDEVKTTR